MASGRTILIAEDSDGDRYILNRACQQAHLPFHLQFVKDGLQAMDYLEGKGPFQNRSDYPLPDLVMLDLKMPMADGFDVLRWMQNLPEINWLPVVVFSDSDLEIDKARAQRLGARDYFTKSADMDKLRAMLEQITHRYLKAA